MWQLVFQWTTDDDVIGAIKSIGVSDFMDIKFFENRTNGQSKGYCVVSVGSDTSRKVCIERLPKKEMHGMIPQVVYPTKQALALVRFFLRMLSHNNVVCSLNRSPKRGRSLSRITTITKECKCRFTCKCRCKVLLKVCPQCKDRNKGCLIVWWGRLTMCKGPQASYSVFFKKSSYLIFTHNALN